MHKTIVCLLPVIIAGLFLISGCDLAKPQNQGQEKPAAVQNTPIKNKEPETPQQETEPVKQADEEATVTVKAEPGMGAKGQNYGAITGSPMDFVTVPISAGFRAKDRATLMKIEQALNMYKATNDNKGPASHEEFMENIIKANGVVLTQLPDGQEYVYDPEDGVLKVRMPKKSQ